MRYLTDRKRAEGKGPAHHGTDTHKHMTLTATGLAFLMPVFLYIFGHALGQDHAGVVATFSRPIPAIVTGLVFFIAMMHFPHGAGSVLIDYTKGRTRRYLTIFVVSLSYLITATVLYALIRIAN
ncbi:succinate dehydrogenase, hydrophobic membrane anchor protein [Phaeovulum sp.]|uniref:succinate dehydrogenase, hydrophobic membrane anchor protein n=1 Tax=Phaeovulum sp. TaxID=2934796 RepID=UPI0035657794